MIWIRPWPILWAVSLSVLSFILFLWQLNIKLQTVIPVLIMHVLFVIDLHFGGPPAKK